MARGERVASRDVSFHRFDFRHREGFRRISKRKSKSAGADRRLAAETVVLIRAMATANRTWGADPQKPYSGSGLLLTHRSESEQEYVLAYKNPELQQLAPNPRMVKGASTILTPGYRTRPCGWNRRTSPPDGDAAVSSVGRRSLPVDSHVQDHRPALRRCPSPSPGFHPPRP